MSKSLELMWKEGFVSETQLSVPKINDLYNRKSQNIVDKLQDMFAKNIKALLIGSAGMLIVMSLIGAPFLGIYICCLLAPLIFIAKKEHKKSVNLSKGQSSYDYLISFDDWLKSSIQVYARYYKIFYPMFFLGMATQGVLSKAGGKVIALIVEKVPTELYILGQPYYILIGLGLITMLGFKYSDAIYKWDLNIVYGRQFKKLNELIADMEELRK